MTGMVMPPRLRKFGLALHITGSVGWIGAVAASLVLAVTGLVSDDIGIVRGVYLTLRIIGWYALVPFSLTSLATGLIQSFGTRWGLLRHYWVLISLVMNVVAAAILLMYMQTLSFAADLAAKPTLTGRELDELQSPSPVVHSGGALLLLLVAVLLSVYKPSGMTRYGQRRQRAQASARERALSNP